MDKNPRISVKTHKFENAYFYARITWGQKKGRFFSNQKHRPQRKPVSKFRATSPLTFKDKELQMERAGDVFWVFILSSTVFKKPFRFRPEKRRKRNQHINQP